MKLILNCRKPAEGCPRHRVYVVGERDYKRFLGIYGPSMWIRREYPKAKPKPFLLCGYGWVVSDADRCGETVYIRELTYGVRPIKE